MNAEEADLVFSTTAVRSVEEQAKIFLMRRASKPQPARYALGKGGSRSGVAEAVAEVPAPEILVAIGWHRKESTFTARVSIDGRPDVEWHELRFEQVDDDFYSASFAIKGSKGKLYDSTESISED